jgi:hypothetical protein
MGARSEWLVVGAAALLGLIAPIAAARFADDRLQHGVSQRLSALTGVTARLGAVDVGLSGTVRLSDVALSDMFSARAVEFRASLATLLDGSFAPDELLVERPQLRAAANADGELDIAVVARRVLGRRAAAPGEKPRRSRLRRVVVSDGDLKVHLGAFGVVAAEGVELRPSPHGVRVVTAAVSFRSQSSHHQARSRFLRSAADIDLPSLRVQRAVAVSGEGQLTLGGPALPVRDLMLRFDRDEDSRIGTVTGQVLDAGVPRPLTLRFMPEDGQLSAAVEQLPLALLSSRLPEVDLDRAHLSGSLQVRAGGGGEWSATGSGAISGATLRQGHLTGTPVDFDLSADVAIATRLGEVSVHAALRRSAATIELDARLPDPRTSTPGRRGEIVLHIPEQPCLTLLDSLPVATRGATAGLTVAGHASGRLHLAIDWEAAVGDAVTLGGNLDLTRCQVVAEAPGGDPAVLRRLRDHQFPDGSVRRVGPGVESWAEMRRLPAHVDGAFVAAEDARFYEHHGFDLAQIARSLEINVRQGQLLRGGSTLTQQLVKNVFLTHRRTFARKLQEAILTWRVEATTSKRDILENYLNIVELGPGVFGIEQAAQHWFGKPARRLAIHESAFLAALTPEPRTMSRRIAATGGLDPASRQRVEVILRAMKRGGLITESEHDQARTTALELRPAVLRVAATPPPARPTAL